MRARAEIQDRKNGAQARGRAAAWHGILSIKGQGVTNPAFVGGHHLHYMAARQRGEVERAQAAVKFCTGRTLVRITLPSSDTNGWGGNEVPVTLELRAQAKAQKALEEGTQRNRASCRKTSNETVEGAGLFLFAVATRPATEQSLSTGSVCGGIVCQLPGIRCHLNASELRSKQCVRRTRARVSKSVAARARAAVPL